MPDGCMVVTGVARYSLGEAVVRDWASRRTGVPVVTIDFVPNPELEANSEVREVLFDLNPLNHTGGFAGYAGALADELENAVASAGQGGVRYLVQCAGVYDFGAFVDCDVSRIQRVLGLNVLGTTEVLHSAMKLNARLGRREREAFVHMLVGSYHGLDAGANRSIYASSKAYGIDLCASLVAGREIGRCMYVAPGPIDTPMLHRNHWVAKAGGPESFFDEVLHGPEDQYMGIFLSCSEEALEQIVNRERTFDLSVLRSAMARYEEVRLNAFASELGVLRPEACARAMIDLLIKGGSDSGLRVITASPGEGVPVARSAAFSELARRGYFAC